MKQPKNHAPQECKQVTINRDNGYAQPLRAYCLSVISYLQTYYYQPPRMNKNGPIIIIEDDPDDQQMLVDIFASLHYTNPVVYFFDGEAALTYLNRDDVQPFLILSDINMPRVNGFELRNTIFTNQALQSKCIPFLFFTTGANKKSVVDAYALSVQGFFKKPSSVKVLEETIRKIIEYWKECIAPSEYA